MKFFDVTVGTIIMRFYLMMAVAFVAGFANIPWLAILCLPILLSAMLGINFGFGKAQTVVAKKVGATGKMDNTMHQAA